MNEKQVCQVLDLMFQQRTNCGKDQLLIWRLFLCVYSTTGSV